MQRTLQLAAAGVGLGVLGLGMTRYWYSRRLSRMTVSKSHSNESALLHLLAYDGMAFMGSQYANNLEMECRSFQKTQDSLALTLMRSAAPSTYGRKHNFAALSTVEMLRDQHPVTKPEYYDDIIAAVAAGERQALFGPQVSVKQLGRTSGTSGTHRTLVTTDDQSRAFFLYGVMVAFDTMFRWIPNALQPQKDLKLMFRPRYQIAEGSGLRIGPNSSSPEDVKSTAALYSTPMEAYECENERETLYLHMLFALRDPQLGLMESNFASGVLDALVLLDDPKIRKALIGDIARGTISQEHTGSLAPAARETLLQGLEGDRERAAEVLRALLAHDARGKRVTSVDGSQEGIGEDAGAAGGVWKSSGSLVGDLWPNLRCVLAVTTGQFRVYKDVLRRVYLPPASVLPIYSPFYAATEGLIGVNVAPFDDGVPPPPGKRAFFVEALRDGLRGAGSAMEMAPAPGPPPARPEPTEPGAAPAPTVPQGEGEEEKAALDTLSEQERRVAEQLLPLGGGTLPAENAYLLHPRAMVFELLPLQGPQEEETSGNAGGGSSGNTDEEGEGGSVRRHQEGGAVLPQDAVVGESYELVATNLSGLWRCRIGDVVKVIGKHRGQVPVVLFGYRQGQVLNAKGEKSSERCLLEAMRSLDAAVGSSRGAEGTSGGGSADGGGGWFGTRGGGASAGAGEQEAEANRDMTSVIDFAFVEPALAAEAGLCSDALSRYTAFVELGTAGGGDAQVIDEDALAGALDDGLKRSNMLYGDFRESGRLLAPAVRVVAPGTFCQVRSSLVQAGAGATQAKVPRVLRSQKAMLALTGGY